jgi:quinol monooxygenase YgiN
MLVVHVHVRVLPDHVAAFKAATLQNANASLKEPGVARFDVIQSEEDPTRFVLVEVYRDAKAPAEHKDSHHYRAWRDTVEAMMAEPRKSQKYHALFPDELRWNTPD